MTQQLDLTFNTANTTDKMMAQAQSYSNKNAQSYDSANSFGSYLDTAQKSYPQEDRKSVNYEQNTAQNNVHTKNEKKQELNKKDEKGAVTSEKDAQVYNENSQVSSKDVKKEIADNNEIKDIISENDMNLVSNTDDMVAENVEVNVKELMLVSDAQLANVEIKKEDVTNLEKSLELSELQVDDEIPVEAIKSGINLETLAKATDTTVENTKGVDMAVVENAIKDTKVSKDDAISAMYQAKTSKQEENGNIVNNDNMAEKEPAKNDEVQIDAKNDIKIVDSEDVEVKNTILDLKTEVEQDLKFDNSIKTTDNTQDVIKDETLNTQDLKEAKVVENIKTEKDDIRATKEDNDDVQVLKNSTETDVEHTVEAVNLSEISQKMVQNQEVSAPVEKMNKLQDEVQSAKLENAYEHLSTQDEKLSNADNDKKVADKFAKTNVKSDETMKVDEDTKGIEFVSKQSDKVVEKQSTPQDLKVEAVKEKVENVKIQVEDDVKVVTNNQNVQDSAKVEKANETMNKAGLTTKTLREMDGKVTSFEAGEQAGAQFQNETSQEMLMRDMLSQDATTSSAEAKTTVEFTQSLNKATTAQQPQAQQNPQEAQEVSILDQIRAKFAVTKQNGLQKISIGLTPESLGKVTVEIVKGQNGISAHLLAENPQTKEILEKNLDGLKSALQSQGVSVNNVNVKVAEAGRSSENNNNMFQNGDEQFNQNSSGEHRDGNHSSRDNKHAEFEFMSNKEIYSNNQDSEEMISNTPQMEKTVSIKGGNGKISYKL